MRAGYGLNEGGGDRCVFGGRPDYLGAVAGKATAPFKLRPHGPSRHPSAPHAPDNPLAKAVPDADAPARCRQHHPSVEGVPAQRARVMIRHRSETS